MVGMDCLIGDEVKIPTLRLRSGQAFSQKTREMGHPLHHLFRRLYFFRTSRRRSWGKAIASWPLMPFMVSAATMAFTTASSVAWTVARKIGSRESLGSMVSWWTPFGSLLLGLTAPGL